TIPAAPVVVAPVASVPVPVVQVVEQAPVEAVIAPAPPTTIVWSGHVGIHPHLCGGTPRRSWKLDPERAKWTQVLTEIDPARKGGYALIGDFVRLREQRVQVGAVVVACWYTGPVRREQVDRVAAGRVQADGSVAWGRLWEWGRQQISAMEDIASVLLGAQ